MTTELTTTTNTELSVQKVLSSTGKHSAKIYDNLASDPVMEELMHRKDLTYREILLVVSTVVAAMDAEISTLREQSEPWNRLDSVINTPMFGAKEDEELNNSETAWFRRHLTLRNFCASLLTAIGLSTAFFSFINRDYRDQIKIKNERIKTLESKAVDNEAEIAKQKLMVQERDSSIGTKEAEISRLEAEVAAEVEKRDKAQQDLVARASQAAQVASTAVVSQANLSEQVATLNIDLENARRDLRLKDGEIQRWKELHENEKTAASTALDQVGQLGVDLAEKDQHLRGAVGSWNTLILFLKSKKKGSGKGAEVKFKLKKLLSILENERVTTEKIDGMLATLPVGR